MAKDSFILYLEHREIFETLNDEEAGKLIKAIFEFEDTGQISGLEKSLQIAFIPIKNALNRNKEKYERVCKRNRENGKLGGRPKKPSGFLENSKKSKKADNEHEYDNECDSDCGNEKNINKKIHFAGIEYVSMTNVEYEKLCNTYGKDFADQCIIVLDNYKGANGRKYKDDYRAILNWVVNRVREDRVKSQKNTNSIGNNPFLEIAKEEGIF